MFSLGPQSQLGESDNLDKAEKPDSRLLPARSRGVESQDASEAS